MFAVMETRNETGSNASIQETQAHVTGTTGIQCPFMHVWPTILHVSTYLVSTVFVKIICVYEIHS